MKKITCKYAGRLMMLAVYKEADPRTQEILRAHTANCPECKAELKSLEKFRASADLRGGLDVSGELLANIKARSAQYLPGERRSIFPGRLVLRPVLALVIAGIIIFSFSRLITVDDAAEIAVHEDYEYRVLDERLVEAENTLYTINIDLLAGFNDF